jgi:POT family proton-dependent oligopeptide transporter
MAFSCTIKSADSFECEHVEILEPEKRNLRRVCDDISLDIFLVAVVELAERFTYRSITAPMREFYLLSSQRDIADRHRKLHTAWS